MIALQTLLRRTAAALSAIVALTATGYATAQTPKVLLKNSAGVVTGQCDDYETMAVTPSGGISITCTTASSSAGRFTLVAPSNLPVNFTTSTEVQVTRTLGTDGDVAVAFLVTGGSGCSAITNSPLTFPAGSSTSIPIVVNTTLTGTGACTVAITPSAGSPSGSPRTITVVDPDAAVTFAFASTALSSASVGGSPETLTVTRSGGTANTWRVPYTLEGTLAPSGTLLTGTLNSSISGGSLNFASGSSSATLIYSPPPSTPGSVSLPLTLGIRLGTPVNVTSSSSPQLGTVSGANPHSNAIRLSGPVAGCPAPETAADSLNTSGFLTLLRQADGVIKTYVLPTPAVGKSSGMFGLYDNPYSNPLTLVGFSTEIHINKCKGLVQETSNACYTRTTTTRGAQRIWVTRLIEGGKYSTQEQLATAKLCYAPTSEGPWYINVRYNTPGGCGGGSCGWHATWYNWSL